MGSLAAGWLDVACGGFGVLLAAGRFDVACSGPYFENTVVTKVFIANDWPCGWRSWMMVIHIYG